MSRQSVAAFVVVGVIALALLYGLWRVSIYFSDKRPVACEVMPSEADVRRVFADHADTVAAVQAVGRPGDITVDVMTGEYCTGKADIGIFFGTESQKKQIQKILGPDFFGVPYRLFNI